MLISAYYRLARAGYVLAREGALSIVSPKDLPGPLKLGIWLGRLIRAAQRAQDGPCRTPEQGAQPVGADLCQIRPDAGDPPRCGGAGNRQRSGGPAGQDGPVRCRAGAQYSDRGAGWQGSRADRAEPAHRRRLHRPVHKARLVPANGLPRTVAVKILRPGVAQRFMADIESYYAGAAPAERFVRSTKRLKPTRVVETLDRSARLELDLRLEAAAISEMAENIKDDKGFVIPTVSWDHVAQNVLTTSWVDGIPIRDHTALDAAGVDRKALAAKVLQSFLRHAIRDGFFHADMHPGNLFADPRTGDVIAVDFGIMGRINRRERRFLADILYGFITRNYRLVAERHFDIGYVPKDQSVDDFALAIRSIGEPLHGRTAQDISMARVLGQLFVITDLFNMQTRPELVLLQKSMVLVEGVARALDPSLDIWTVAEPVVGDWLRKEEGPLGRVQDIKDQLSIFAEAAQRVPVILGQAELALSDYHANKRPPDRLTRWALLLVAAAGTIFFAVATVRVLLSTS
ncbi:AarF/UbiB family protein [Devosia sp. A8/3-2]|nr:AarF/UbiB family protein [Devosia sp. A8/3-2]